MFFQTIFQKATSQKRKKGVKSHFFVPEAWQQQRCFFYSPCRQWLSKDTYAVFFFSFHKEDISMIIFLLARPLFILKRSRLGGN